MPMITPAGGALVPLTTRALGLATGLALFVAPAASAEMTIAPPGADCFLYAERDAYPSAEYARWPANLIPTVAISGIKKEKSGQTLRTQLSATPPASALFAGTAVPDPDKDGNILLKYAPGQPETIFTKGRPLPTPSTEDNTLVFKWFLNDVEKGSGSITFRVGILAATAPIKEAAGERKKSLWKVSGLGPGRYTAFFRKGGKTVGTLPLGNATGPCGYLTKRQYTEPKKKVKGRFDIVIQSGTTFREGVAQLVYKGRTQRGGISDPFGTFVGHLPELP